MLFYHRRQEELKVALGQQGWQQSWGRILHPVPYPWAGPCAGEGLLGSKAVSSARQRWVPLTGRPVVGQQEVSLVVSSVYMNYFLKCCPK